MNFEAIKSVQFSGKTDGFVSGFLRITDKLPFTSNKDLWSDEPKWWNCKKNETDHKMKNDHMLNSWLSYKLFKMSIGS